MHFSIERIASDLYGELKEKEKYISRYVIRFPWKERQMFRKSSVRWVDIEIDGALSKRI